MKLKFFSLLGSVLLGTFALFELTYGVQSTVHIYGFAIFKEECSPLMWIIPLCVGALLLFFMRQKTVLYEYALRPLWLTPVIFVWPNDSSGMFCYALALFVWSAFRLGSLQYRKFEKIPEISVKYSWPLVLFLTIFTLSLSWYLQNSAFKALYLIFGDWGQYAESYLVLASGSASLKQWLCAAGHFNPLINLIMTAAIKIAASAQTVFCVNAMVIASAVPLSFCLARCSGLKNNMALCCAFLAAIYPIFTRQSLCLFYGFHPIIFFMPLLLCFFIARSRKSLWGMTLCIVLSLLVQETVAIFWIGWGLYLFAVKKQYIPGALLALAMVGWFALLALVVQPWGGEAAVYAQSFRYATLGNTPVEIALSPFLRPGAFCTALFSPRNLLFAAIILTPAFFAAAAFPGLLLIGVPLLGGFFIQSADEVKTPLLQYGVELGTLCWAAAIVNMGRLFNGEKSFIKCRGDIRYGALCSVCTGIVIGYFFFGYGYKFGLYPKDYGFFKEDASRAVAFLKKHLPSQPGRLLAAERIRAHFMFEYPVKPLSQEYRLGDWLLLDLHDPAFESSEKTEALRRKLYTDPRCRPVTYVNWFGKHLVLLHIAAADTPHRIPCFQVSEERFKAAAGVMLNTGNPRFDCKYDGRMLHFRLKKTPEADYDLKLRLTFGNGERKKYEYSWFFGLFPAWAQKEGTLWSIPIQQGVVNCEIAFTERPGSSASPKQEEPHKSSKAQGMVHQRSKRFPSQGV